MIMDGLVLCKATTDDGMDVRDMLREIGPGENGFENHAYDLSEADFKKWLQSRVEMETGINLDAKYVPMTTYWLRRNGYPIGTSKLRHRLNEALLQGGGHLGFCIRPTERGKGYAKKLLTLTLARAQQMGITKVLLTCDIGNAPSWRTIESCGGKLERTTEKDRFYWIQTG